MVRGDTTFLGRLFSYDLIVTSSSGSEWKMVALQLTTPARARAPLTPMASASERTLNRIAALGLLVGAGLGLAGTLVTSPHLQASLWAMLGWAWMLLRDRA